MYHIIQFSEARNNLTHYINKVEQGHKFVIVRFGRPVARLIPHSEAALIPYPGESEKDDKAAVSGS